LPCLLILPLVLITGVSPKSLGEALVLSLSVHSPALLILASRTPSKLSLVFSKILAQFPALEVLSIPLDLASQSSVRAAASKITSLIGNRKLDVLFNNAGINGSQRRLTEDGVEAQFGTNYVGPFLFTNLLMPLLLRGEGGGRVVMTSSEAHRISPVRFSDWNLEPGKKVPEDEEPSRRMPEGILRGDGRYEPAIAYGQSKTADILFAVGLNARVGSRGVKSFALNPGSEFMNCEDGEED
jgi:NAD(P)-dependent dehydrogenase (short-subunit alcohol dehydrogenase family)